MASRTVRGNWCRSARASPVVGYPTILAVADAVERLLCCARFSRAAANPPPPVHPPARERFDGESSGGGPGTQLGVDCCPGAGARYDDAGQPGGVRVAGGEQRQSVACADRVTRGEGDGAGGGGLAVDLERGGRVQFADAVAQGDPDGGTEPRHHVVEADGPVVGSEVVCCDVRRLGRGPVELGVQVRHPLGLGRPGELGDQMQRGGDTGGHRGRRGHRPVLDVPTAADPVHRGTGGLELADPRPVTGGVQAVEHPGGGQDERPGAHAEDLRSVVVLVGHPACATAPRWRRWVR